jgi:c-di-GMP-binding flagellar brake protein YcgR
MTPEERRKRLRIKALNLISYRCLDEAGQTLTQGMGRTLNLSEDGILLETRDFVDPKYTVVMAIGLEEDLIDIKGRVVYSIGGGNERFEAGIEFIETDEATIEVLKKYIKSFREKS